MSRMPISWTSSPRCFAASPWPNSWITFTTMNTALISSRFVQPSTGIARSATRCSSSIAAAKATIMNTLASISVNRFMNSLA